MQNGCKNRAKKDRENTIRVAFSVNGQEMILKSVACAAMGWNPGPRFEALCKKLRLRFCEMTSPRTRHRVLVCTKRRIVTAIQTLETRRKNPPPIDGHRTGWLTEVFSKKPSHETLKEWTELCRHLDGEKFRATQVPWCNGRWYGDVEQAKRIIASQKAESLGEVLPKRMRLTAIEANWVFGVTARQLRKWARSRIVRAVGRGRRKLYPRVQIEQALRGSAQGVRPDSMTLAEAVPFSEFTRAQLKGMIARGVLESEETYWPGTKKVRNRLVSKSALVALPPSKPRKTFNGEYPDGWFNLRAAVAQVEGITLSCLRQAVGQGKIRSEWRERLDNKRADRAVQLADVIAYREE